MNTIGQEVTKHDSGKVEHSHALMTIGALVRRYPLSITSFQSGLSQLMEAVVRSLDPNVPSLRDGCIQAATAALHVLVKKYPMVSFHQGTQHLAVGTTNYIIIYDLRTATKAHILEVCDTHQRARCSHTHFRVTQAQYALWPSRKTDDH